MTCIHSWVFSPRSEGIEPDPSENAIQINGHNIRNLESESQWLQNWRQFFTSKILDTSCNYFTFSLSLSLTENASQKICTLLFPKNPRLKTKAPVPEMWSVAGAFLSFRRSKRNKTAPLSIRPWMILLWTRLLKSEEPTHHLRRYHARFFRRCQREMRTAKVLRCSRVLWIIFWRSLIEKRPPRGTKLI